MPRASYSYRITAHQVGLGTDPAFVAAPASVRAEVLRWIVVFGLIEKDKDLAAGLDKNGNPLVPIRPSTRKYRRSAMGPADPNAPPLMPAYAVSRTRLLLDGRAIDKDGGYAEFFWRYDDHTGATWGRILDFQRRGVGRANVSRDVIGVSLDLIARVRAKVLAKWAAFRANGYKEPAKVPQPKTPIPKIAVIGRTDFENFTYGIGSAGGAERSRQALATGHSTGMFQLGPGQGRPAIGGPGTTGPPPKPVKPAPKVTPAPKPKPKPAPVATEAETLAARKAQEALWAKAKAEAERARARFAAEEKAKQAAAALAELQKRPAVSSAFTVEVTGPTGASVHRALAAIDRVHRGGSLRRVPIEQSESTELNGAYSFSTATGQPLRIEVSVHGKTPALTSAHEVGHYLDGSAIPGHKAADRDYAADPLFEDWYRAVQDSDARKTLSAKELESSKYVQYLLRPDELWARSYAQYIAIRSGDTQMIDELDSIRGSRHDRAVPRQWAEDDFTSIARAIDQLFEEIRWRNPN